MHPLSVSILTDVETLGHPQILEYPKFCDESSCLTGVGKWNSFQKTRTVLKILLVTLLNKLKGMGGFLCWSVCWAPVGQQSSPSSVTTVLEHHIVIVGIPAGTLRIKPSLQSHSSTFWHQMWGRGMGWCNATICDPSFTLICDGRH